LAKLQQVKPGAVLVTQCTYSFLKPNFHIPNLRKFLVPLTSQWLKLDTHCLH